MLTSDDNYHNDVIEVSDETQADLIGSKIKSVPSFDAATSKEHTFHYPVLDFDFPCYVIDSVNENNGHLYLDTLVHWDDYKKLLDVLLEIGLIQHAWYENAMTDGQTFVRTEDRIKHDKLHGKESDCFPGCLDEFGNEKEEYKNAIF